MENEQDLLSGLVSEYELGDLSEEEEEGEEEGDDEEALPHRSRWPRFRRPADAERSLLPPRVRQGPCRGARVVPAIQGDEVQPRPPPSVGSVLLRIQED